MADHPIHAEVPLVVFDDRKGTFGPLVDLRPPCLLRAGLGTLLDGIEHHAGRCAAAHLGAPRHAAILEESGRIRSATAPAAGTVLLVNGRLLEPAVLAGEPLRASRILRAGDGALVAALVEADEVAPLLEDRGPVGTPTSARLASAPWDLTGAIGATLEADLDAGRAGAAALPPARHLRPDEGQSFGTHPIRIAADATIGPFVAIDASKGPVVVGPRAVVRPFAVLVGPCAILDDTIVSERALVKASTVVGPHCRIGGEIGGTIVQGHSNKSHDGHLGDSFVGEWVNIGAGSDNSNLLNTYGEVVVRLEPDGGLLRTGRRFWGSVVGDHAKLAIGTRLMTGTTIGTGAMIAQSTPPPALVPRFAWATDAGTRTFRLDRFLETARAMMARRGQAPGPALVAALSELHARATEAR
jgi:UDP-N-acetylglucosamine diphosphorylase/glucosamine-1-phosphate N-acetyltransferase